MPILEVRNLTAGYSTGSSVVENLSFTLGHGETLGLCGPSGCGKTTVVRSLLGILSDCGGYAHGEALYGNVNLLRLPERQWRNLRWSEISLVPQGAMTTLNPVFTIGRTFRETINAHAASPEDPKSLLKSVGLSPEMLQRYPHQLSGGELRRTIIALAALFRPKIIILDEATAGLDVLVEADILKLLCSIQNKTGLSMIFISHDRRITAEFCHRRIEI